MVTCVLVGTSNRPSLTDVPTASPLDRRAAGRASPASSATARRPSSPTTTTDPTATTATSLHRTRAPHTAPPARRPPRPPTTGAMAARRRRRRRRARSSRRRCRMLRRSRRRPRPPTARPRRRRRRRTRRRAARAALRSRRSPSACSCSPAPRSRSRAGCAAGGGDAPPWRGGGAKAWTRATSESSACVRAALASRAVDRGGPRPRERTRRGWRRTATQARLVGILGPVGAARIGGGGGSITHTSCHTLVVRHVIEDERTRRLPDPTVATTISLD